MQRINDPVFAVGDGAIFSIDHLLNDLHSAVDFISKGLPMDVDLGAETHTHNGIDLQESCMSWHTYMPIIFSILSKLRLKLMYRIQTPLSCV